MKAKIKDGNLIISIPINPKISASGKSIVLASTAWDPTTELKYEGKNVKIILNAYIPR